MSANQFNMSNLNFSRRHSLDFQGCSDFSELDNFDFSSDLLDFDDGKIMERRLSLTFARRLSLQGNSNFEDLLPLQHSKRRKSDVDVHYNHEFKQEEEDQEHYHDTFASSDADFGPDSFLPALDSLPEDDILSDDALSFLDEDLSTPEETYSSQQVTSTKRRRTRVNRPQILSLLSPEDLEKELEKTRMRLQRSMEKSAKSRRRLDRNPELRSVKRSLSTPSSVLQQSRMQFETYMSNNASSFRTI